MNDKIKGIVLRIQDYKDNDLLLQVLSADKGILSLIGKSAKKMTSKQHYYEGSIYEFMIDYKDGKTIFGIHGSTLIKNNYDINNMRLMSFKNILYELIIKSKELYEISFYNNLMQCLEFLNDNNKYLIGCLFVSYMCKVHGIIPNVDECVVCHSKKVVSISNNLGGFLCLEHLNGEQVLDVNTLKKFRLMAKADFKNYSFIKDMEYTFNDFKLFIEFFEINSGLNLKTYDFYKKVM